MTGPGSAGSPGDCCPDTGSEEAGGPGSWGAGVDVLPVGTGARQGEVVSAGAENHSSPFELWLVGSR